MTLSWFSRPSARAARRRASFRPAVDQLEARCLLSVLVQPAGVIALAPSAGAPAAAGADAKPVHTNAFTHFGGDGNDDPPPPPPSQVTLFGGSGDDTLTSGGGDSVTLFGGDGNDPPPPPPPSQITLFGGSGDDTLTSGSGGNITLGGGNGSDTLSTGGTGATLPGGNGSDTLSTSGGSNITLFGGSGDDTLAGGSGSDTLSTSGGSNITLFGGNGTDSTSAGANGTPPGTGRAGPGATMGPLAPGQGSVFQVVLLDFDSATVPGEHVYSPAQRAAIQGHLEGIYGQFRISFTQDAAQASALAAGGPYSTLVFNKGQPGGAADAFDFRNLDHGDTAAVDANGLLGRPGQPADTPDNFTALSATIAAHELGHLLGLRHADSFGPLGAGIVPSLASAYIPAYAGPTGAVETYRHVMASPESVGSTLADAVNGVYLGEREAIKLAFDASGVVVNEQAGPHGTFAAAQALGQLPALSVPNTLRPGDRHYGQTLTVGALDVVGAIAIDPTTGRSESDVYSFAGRAGDLYDLAVLSGTLPRMANPIDSVVRLYDASGKLLATSDDDFESHDSSLLDVRLPADGTYYVVVSSYNPTGGPALDVDSYELYLQRYTPPDASPGAPSLGPAPGVPAMPGGVTGFAASAGGALASLQPVRPDGTITAVPAFGHPGGSAGSAAATGDTLRVGAVGLPVVQVGSPAPRAAPAPVTAILLVGGAEATGSPAEQAAPSAAPSASPKIPSAGDSAGPAGAGRLAVPALEPTGAPPATDTGTLPPTGISAEGDLSDVVFAGLLRAAGADHRPGEGASITLALLGLGALLGPDLARDLARSRPWPARRRERRSI
jgi:hypothetical protein